MLFSWGQLRVVFAGLALAGCGRLGFSAHVIDAKTDGGASESGTHSAEPDDDGGSVVDGGSGGSDMGDAGARHGEPGPSDAGNSPMESDASTNLDGSVAQVPPDASTSSFSCADFSGSIACVTFNDRLPQDWYLDQGARSDHPRVYDGYLDAHSQGSQAYSYAGCEFSAIQDGTLYLRMRVMFPSDGDGSSVDFITVGSYDNNDDYGVELDLVDDKLAFNSSTDGFIYGDFMLPRDTWLCLDARLVLSDKQGEMSINVDGQRALDVTGVDTVPYNGVKLVDLGIDWTRRPERYAHVLVDEFVLSRDVVSCP